MAGLLESLKNLQFNPTPMSTGLMMAGANMMQAGGPSLAPRNFGTAFGSGMEGLVQGALMQRKQQQDEEEAKAMQAYRDALMAGKIASADSGNNPYFQAISTPQGIATLDARTGKISLADINGKPVMKSPDDPALQAQITAAKEGQKLHKFVNPMGREGYGRGTDITAGAVPDLIKQPMSQSGVNMSMTVKPSMMQHLIDVWGTPENAVAEIKRNPGAYADKEFGADQSTMSQRQGPVMGPSMQEKAALEIQKKQAAADIENQKKITQAEQKKQMSADNMLKLVSKPYDGKTIEQWIDSATGSGIGAGVDKLIAASGQALPGSIANEKLKTLQGWLVSNVPRMEGPQSDFDVQNYKQMASNISDPSVPAEIKKASFATMKEIMSRYDENGQPKQSTPSASPNTMPSNDLDSLRSKYYK